MCACPPKGHIITVFVCECQAQADQGQCTLGVACLRAAQALTSALHPELVQGQLDLPCRTCDQILYFIGPQAAAILQQANVLLQRPDCVVRVGGCPACIPTCLSWVVIPVNPATPEVVGNEGKMLLPDCSI